VPGAERRAAAVPGAVPGAAALVADYQGWLAGDGRGSACYRDAAWAFLGRWNDPAAFAAEPLAVQQALTSSQRPFLTYLMLHGRCRPGYAYLAHRKIGGLLAAARRSPLADDITRFAAAATDLDYSGHVVKRAAERVAVRLLIQTGRPLAELTGTDVEALAVAFRACAEAKGNASTWANDRGLVTAAHRVLFHLGVLAHPPEDPRRRPGLGGHYSGVAEPLRGLLLPTAPRPRPPGRRPRSRRSPATWPGSAGSCPAPSRRSPTWPCWTGARTSSPGWPPSPPLVTRTGGRIRSGTGAGRSSPSASSSSTSPSGAGPPPHPGR
jgi:hypothetical protein